MNSRRVEVVRGASDPVLGFTQVEKFIPYALAATILYVALRCVLEAVARPFWFDELCTWAVVQQGGPRAIWNALWQSVDGQPPFYYMIVRFATWFVKTPEISYRIPSIAGLCATMVFVYLMVRKLTNPIVGYLGALLIALTPLYHFYAVEARPYTLVVAFMAAAVHCYQNASSKKWIVAMGLCLMFAQGVHYYAILMFMPLAIAEASLSMTQRRIRWGIWASLGVGVLPLIVCWPLLFRFKHYYGAHFGSHQTFLETMADYGWFIHSRDFAISRVVAGLPVAIILIALLIAIRSGRGNGQPSIKNISDFVLPIGFLCLPVFMFLVTEAAHSGLADRYTLVSILGLPLTLTVLSPLEGSRFVRVLAIIAIVWLGYEGSREEKYYYSYSPEMVFSNPSDSFQRLSSQAGHPELPLVVSHSDDFIQLWYYAPPGFRPRFLWNSDPVEALAYKGFDTSDLELMALKKVIPLQEQRFGDFIDTHPAFLLYSSGKDVVGDWWPRRLAHDGYYLDLVAKSQQERLYLVRRPGSGS